LIQNFCEYIPVNAFFSVKGIVQIINVVIGSDFMSSKYVSKFSMTPRLRVVNLRTGGCFFQHGEMISEF
jgi:hypothetical protein